MRKITKRTAAVVAGGALAVATAGTAFAYWTTTGSGSGSGATQSQSVSLTFSTAQLTDMFPGDSSQPLTVTVQNGSTQKAYVAGVKAYVTTNKPGCTGADYLLGGAAAPVDAAHAVPLAWTATDLPANGGSATATSTIQFNDNPNASQNACQGATVTVNYLSN